MRPVLQTINGRQNGSHFSVIQNVISENDLKLIFLTIARCYPKYKVCQCNRKYSIINALMTRFDRILIWMYFQLVWFIKNQAICAFSLHKFQTASFDHKTWQSSRFVNIQWTFYKQTFSEGDRIFVEKQWKVIYNTLES